MFCLVHCGVKKATRELLFAQLKAALVRGILEDGGFDCSKHMPLHCFLRGEKGCFFITLDSLCIGSLEWQKEDGFVRIFVDPLHRRRGAARAALEFVRHDVDSSIECEVALNCKSGLAFVEKMGFERIIKPDDEVNVCMEMKSTDQMQPASDAGIPDIVIVKVEHWSKHREALLDLWEGEDDLFEEEERMAIAWDGKEAVGSISWVTDMLMNLRVRPTHRKRGIGGALVRLAVIDCFARGAKDVQIETVNPEAQRLYASVGFKLLAEFDEFRISFSRKDN